MNKVFVIILIVIASSTFAQDTAFFNSGLIRAQGNLAFGKFTSHNPVNMYISADAEYYLNQSVSIRSDAFYMFERNSVEYGSLSQNHSLFTGIMLHKIVGERIDLFTGFQPGIVFVNLKPLSKEFGSMVYTPPLQEVVPLTSLSVGVNYYAKKIFHLFVQIKYVHGELIDNSGFSFNMNELKIAAGLGWNISLKKKK